MLRKFNKKSLIGLISDFKTQEFYSPRNLSLFFMIRLFDSMLVGTDSIQLILILAFVWQCTILFAFDPIVSKGFMVN